MAQEARRGVGVVRVAPPCTIRAGPLETKRELGIFNRARLGDQPEHLKDSHLLRLQASLQRVRTGTTMPRTCPKRFR
jgi:hypothetical protein